jgi:hypothetical protein
MISMMPTEIIQFGPDEDDALLLAASWEERCLGLARRLRGYRAKQVIVTEYDGTSARRAIYLKELRERLDVVGSVSVIQALHRDPLGNVRDTLAMLGARVGRGLRLSIDITTFTRKHLLQLLHGLDTTGLLERCRFFFTESDDYDTRDDEPVAQGITNVRAIETFAGRNHPSRDSLLVLFLGYEGRRALALWEHLEPNATLVVIPDPPYRPEWQGRTEAMNQYLLSCLAADRVLRVSAMNPSDTEALLDGLVTSDEFSLDRFNYRLAPIGPKPQLIGLYRFWRRHRGSVTVMYAAPVRYREEHPGFPPGRSWFVDTSENWTPDQNGA